MPSYGTVNRGTVRRVEADGVSYRVEIRAINPGRVAGPMPSVVHGLAVGDAVLVASLGQSRDDLMIVGRYPPIPPPELGIDDVTGLQDALDSLEPPFVIDDVTGLQAALDGRATDAELASLASTVTTLSTNTTTGLNALDARLDIVEPAVTTLQSNVVTLSAADTALSGRITTLEGRAVPRTYVTASIDTAFSAASKVLGTISVPSPGAGISYNLTARVAGRLFMSAGKIVEVYIRNATGGTRIGGIAYFANQFGGNADISAAAPILKSGPFSGALSLELYANFTNPGSGLGFVPGSVDYLSGAVCIEPV
jgi:hypothetical protein